MGREDDKMAVVDSELKVYGVDNLRIADASVMPLITSGNTNAPSIMIGERAAVSEFRSASARWAQGILSPQNVSVLAFGAAGLDLGRLSAIGLASARDKEREREREREFAICTQTLLSVVFVIPALNHRSCGLGRRRHRRRRRHHFVLSERERERERKKERKKERDIYISV